MTENDPGSRKTLEKIGGADPFSEKLCREKAFQRGDFKGQCR